MVNKITSPITPLGEIDKINEIIDELDNIDPLPSQTGQSGKYLTTNGTVPSWADVQNLPSQTGKAGLYLQTDGTDASWQGAPGRNIGEIVASTIPLTDAGLHLLDGSLIQGSGIYSAFVDYIAGLDLTANYFCTEQEWQTSITTYGVCGKFVYDSTNNTVRLPKVTGILEGTTDVSALGDLVEAGLPNLSLYTPNSSNKYGAQANVVYNVGSTRGGGNSVIAIDQNPKLYVKDDNNIVGNSSTVQPQTIKAFYYIVIATSTKTDIQVDIDEVVTDLNGKADADLTNVNDTGYIKMAGAGMPSNKYINLTLGASGTTYTAPATGWVSANIFNITQAGYLYLYCNGYVDEKRVYTTGVAITTTIPVKKGGIITIRYDANGTKLLRFIYAQGSESEVS